MNQMSISDLLASKFDKEIEKLKKQNRFLDHKEKKQRTYNHYADPSEQMVEEWEEAFYRFCRKTRNIYGDKVDRLHLLDSGTSGDLSPDFFKEPSEKQEEELNVDKLVL